MKKKHVKNTKEVKILKAKLVGVIFLIDLISVILMYFIMPKVQGFPPYSEDFAFQRKVQTLTHIQQYTVALIIGVSLHIFSFKLLMKKIYSYMNKFYKKEAISQREIEETRADFINIPYKVFIFQMILFFSVGLFFNFIMLAQFFAIIKFTLMILSLASLISILLLITTQRLLSQVILTTYEVTDKYDRHTGYRITNATNIMIQVIPFITVLLFIISLIGYSKAAEQKGFANASYYKASLLNKQITSSQVNMNDLKTILSSIELNEKNDFYFIISPNDEEIYVSSENGTISDFVLDYRDFFYDKTGGILYEAFGVDEQLYSLKLQDDQGQTWYVGFKYPVIDTELLIFYLLIMVFVIITYSTLLYFVAKNITNNLRKIVTSLQDILKNPDDINSTKILPITSNDEFGDLSYYYNKIHELTVSNINQIHENQDLLMEKERLASLGQLIGGIAHNLKTPIMSISGAAEGLSDLVREYEASIGDPEVNSNDHHEIAKDMSSWITKVKEYTEYMSDVITAVKGQAVNLSSDETITFTIDELVKRVNILMKHELKNALINLNLNVLVDTNIELKGDVNSLVQVINNMISNSIQSYNGEANRNIDFVIKQEKNNIIFSIQDYGCGMSKEVKDKLFKEMITTKGKNGTGLGLFMSYSTIRGNFGGNITFDSEKGKGTTFNIILPM